MSLTAKSSRPCLRHSRARCLPGIQVPIPGIVFLNAAKIFPVAFDSYFLKIVRENPAVIPQECFQNAGICEIQVCPVCCSLFGWWQWHFYCFCSQIFGQSTQFTMARCNCLLNVQYRGVFYVYPVIINFLKIGLNLNS
jgi:hypothetical protein